MTVSENILWVAVTDNGMDITTYIVLASSAEDAVTKVDWPKFKAEDFKPAGRDVFTFYENRWPDA
jgi:hypothetical protein